MEKSVKWVSLGIDLTLKVSRHGGGYYLRIPRGIARSLGLNSLMLVQVKLKKKGVTE